MALKKKSGLLEAAEAMRILAKAKGTIQQTHCVIEGGLAKMTDGNLSIGFPAGTDVEFVPQVSQFAEAAKNIEVNQDATMGVSDDGRVLTILTGGKRLVLQGADRSLIKSGVGDPNIAPATDALRSAFELATKILDPKSPDGRKRNAFSLNGILTASDGEFAVQFYHAVDLPPGIAFGVEFMKAVLKIKSPIVGFGFNGLSATIWFENEAYVKGRVEQVIMPDVSAAFGDYPKDWLEAKQFIAAVRSIVKFSPSGFVLVDQNRVEAFLDQGQSYNENFDPCNLYTPASVAYAGTSLLRLEKQIGFIAFGKESDSLFFTDNKTYRGVTKRVVKPNPVLYNPSIEPDDEIPY